MLYRVPMFAPLLSTLLACGFAGIAAAQFEEENEEQSFSEDDGSPAERGGVRDREDRDRGARGRGEPGERGRRGPRPNPLFEVLDMDGDGMISSRELRQAIRNLKTLDTDGDGNISLEEASPMRGPGGRGGDPNEMVDRMMENDLNGDGVLTQDEIPEQLARMLTGADLNGDGAIDRNELQQAMQNMRGAGGRGGFGGPGGGNFGGPGGDPDAMSRQIMSLDRNGDGTISADELNPQMARMLQGADTNGDGVLDAKEIRIYMETSRQRMQQFRGQGGGQGGFNRGGQNGDVDPRQRRRDRDQQQ